MDLGYDPTLLVTNLTSAVVRASVTGKGPHIECYNCIQVAVESNCLVGFDRMQLLK